MAKARASKNTNSTNGTLTKVSNPFSSSRVDTPFQSHPDALAVYQSQFAILEQAIAELQDDGNHQSRGVVVVGKPGAGKTHLMMRLAQKRLMHNTLFYIRQPNHADNVFYHIYARMMESLVETIPETNHTQLQRFLGRCFMQILQDSPEANSTKQGEAIIKTLKNDTDSLFQRDVGNLSKQYNKDWNFITRHVVRWWTETYSSAGQSPLLLTALIKYCGYIDPSRRELCKRYITGQYLSDDELAKVNLSAWHEATSREEFALEAMTMLGKLSLLDEPLIIVFDQLEGLSKRPDVLESFTHAIKETLSYVPNSLMIFNLFPDRWKQFRDMFDESVVGRMAQFQVWLERPTDEQLANILQEKMTHTELKLDDIFSKDELADILSLPSIRAVLNRAAAYYRHKSSGIPLPELPDAPELTTASDKTQEKATETPVIEEILIPEMQPKEARAGDNLEERISNLEKFTEAFAKSTTQAFQTITEALALMRKANQVSSKKTPLDDVKFEVKPQTPIVTNIPSPAPSTEKPQEENVQSRITTYLDAAYTRLEATYQNAPIIDDNDDIGKLRLILDAFSELMTLNFKMLRHGSAKLPPHMHITTPKHTHIIGFLSTDPRSFTSRIKNFNSIALQHADANILLLRDAREKPIKGKVGKEAIAELNELKNGSFDILEKATRLNFELAYDVVVAVNNQDLECDIADALTVFMNYKTDNTKPWHVLESLWKDDISHD